MRVLCINDKPIPGFTVDSNFIIKEGEVYDVAVEFYGIYSGIKYYGLVGYNYIIGYDGHHADRFIPLSEIDEVELANKRKKYEPA